MSRNKHRIRCDGCNAEAERERARHWLCLVSPNTRFDEDHLSKDFCSVACIEAWLHRLQLKAVAG